MYVAWIIFQSELVPCTQRLTGNSQELCGVLLFTYGCLLEVSGSLASQHKTFTATQSLFSIRQLGMYTCLSVLTMCVRHFCQQNKKMYESTCDKQGVRAWIYNSHSSGSSLGCDANFQDGLRLRTT